VTLYRMPQVLLMIDLDQPTYKICTAAATRVGLRPFYALSTAPLHVAPRGGDLSAIILDAENSNDTFAAFSRIEQLFPLAHLLVVTGRDHEAERRLAMRLGARQVFPKPCDQALVERTLRQLVFENDGNRPAQVPAGERAHQDSRTNHLVCWRCGAELLECDENRALADREKRAVLTALKLNGGNKLRAARMLGIGKTTLYRRLKEYRTEAGAECDIATDYRLRPTSEMQSGKRARQKQTAVQTSEPVFQPQNE